MMDMITGRAPPPERAGCFTPSAEKIRNLNLEMRNRKCNKQGNSKPRHAAVFRGFSQKGNLSLIGALRRVRERAFGLRGS